VTRSCSSGKEALALAADWSPDLILLDVMMPAMDGPTTLAHLRDNPVTRGIPVIFVTARVEIKALSGSHDAVGTIAKPFDPMTLAALVRGYLEPDHRFDALRKIFLQRIKKDAFALASLRSAIEEGRSIPTTLAGIRAIAHSLAGAGGMFGFSEISDTASALEDAVVATAGSQEPGEDIAFALDRLLTLLKGHITLH